jgi:signal transduction histidine kinase/DNA-binding NarL/FixJ family response regulator
MSERGRVWILEDSALEAEMARRALASSQEVSLFDDGSVVLERIANGSLPDVLVLDSQLMGVSGLEVCRVVREKRGPMDLPVLMLTVQGGQQDVIEAFAAGANDYVTKPYHVAELVARVGTLVNAAQLMAAHSLRTRQLALGADVGVALTEGRGLSQVAQRAADAIARHLDAGAVEVWSRTGADLSLTASTSDFGGSLPKALIMEVSADGQVRTSAPSPAAGGLHSVALPLLVRGEVLAVLGIATREPVSDAAASLATVTNLLALGLSRARAEEERFVLLDRERNARGEAEAANRSKDDFLAMVSHELRTPLNAITGWTSMLLAGGLDDARVRRAYETIDRNTRAQAQLIDDLLDIGRITSGQLRLNETSVDLVAVADMALESIRLSAESRGVTLQVDIDQSAGRIVGDAERLQQVIWNLLSNSIKFTPKGGLIGLTLRREAERVEIVVRDNGQGISAAFLPRVFDRFKQADTSATRSRGGLGLGLAIVRHLVELHGGSIQASSEGLGKGAVFTVTLPIEVRQRARNSEVVRLSERPPLDRPHEIEGLRVLVVDDEPDARELLRTLLESCKIEVTTASSAAEAMDVVRRTPLDVLLSDVAMPEEDGLSFIRRVRALSREDGGRVPAVALTAYARLEDRTRALRAGFNAHVAKPVEPNELLAVLSSLATAR